MVRRIGLGLLLAWCLAISVQEATAGTSNSLMDISTDGKLMACANRDANSLSIIDLATRKTTHVLPIGLHPEGVTFLGDSHDVAVAVYGDDVIKVVSAETGETKRSIEVFDEPYSVVASKDGATIYATLDYPGKVLAIDAASGKITQERSAGQFLRGLASGRTARGSTSPSTTPGSSKRSTPPPAKSSRNGSAPRRTTSPGRSSSIPRAPRRTSRTSARGSPSPRGTARSSRTSA